MTILSGGSGCRDFRHLEDGIEDRLFVDCLVERYANLGIVKRCHHRIVGQVADIQAFLLKQGNIRIFCHRFQIGGVRIRHDMALTGFQLLIANGRVRGDGGIDQIIDGGFSGPVIRMGLVTDDRILLVSNQLERSGADRLLVDYRR